jgi:hypothetical protein
MINRTGKILEYIESYKVFSAVTVAAGLTQDTDVIDLYDKLPTGFFSFQFNVTGDGTLKFEVLLSNDGVTYCGPVVCKSDGTTTTIATGITKTGGQNGDGNGIYPFSPAVAKYMKIRATETGAAHAAVLTAWLAIQ